MNEDIVRVSPTLAVSATGEGSKVTAVDWEAMYNDLRNKPDGDSMDFMVTRETPGPGKTFSEDALESVVQAFRTFVVARVGYHWDQKPDRAGPGPGVLITKFTVDVTIDGNHAEPDEDTRPWYVIDGQKRA